MRLARRRAFVVLVLASAAAAALGVAAVQRTPPSLPPRALAQRPPLLLLTSLPLLFNEDFSLGGGGSPAITKLATRYRLLPISVSSPRELSRARLLLMAQPLAQTAENLVALDDWVRRGGRLLLLADPMLEWPSKRPFGDPLRPPPIFADTGLLAHWGLKLEGPDRRGVVSRRLGARAIVTVSPGRLEGRCAISEDRLAGRCRIGEGWVMVVADADLLDTDRLGGRGAGNLDSVLVELDSLERG